MQVAAAKDVVAYGRCKRRLLKTLKIAAEAAQGFDAAEEKKHTIDVEERTLS